ncbi:hypothetical protein [Asticcacaulis sp. YBE204]|uniref:hypothetical protein n=1 Tax=Asticcacaulis sp. YBE204 TaxID=1282363 RepID=UPI0003C3B06C|nr:hypothetical protein [Asticcacaulis sp. YBE204]ESQ81315.1 hypothetical protein AEYBE204_02950 [Asticcacaulis sp. YBE204]
MKTLISLFISLFLWLPLSASAEVSAADSKAIDQAFDGFMVKVNAKQYDEAYTTFMLPLISEQAQLQRNLVGLTKQVAEYFVEPIKYEKVEENALGSNLVYRKYILFNDRAPYVVAVVMFRTTQGWKGQHITLRDLTPDEVAP